MVGVGTFRVLPDEVDHYVSKVLTQRLERTNSILRQQTGRWHRRQNKFSKLLCTNSSNRAISCQLFQLDLAAFTFGNYGGVGVQI